MRLQVKGKNVELSDSLKSYAQEKLGKLDKHLNDAARLELELAVERNPSISDNQIAEATIWTKGPVLRARESSTDMRASIDLLVEKLERQARRYRDKRKRGPSRPNAAAPELEAIPVVPDEDSPGDRQDEAVRGQADEPGGGGAPARAHRARLLRLPERGVERRQRPLPPPRRTTTASSSRRSPRTLSSDDISDPRAFRWVESGVSGLRSTAGVGRRRRDDVRGRREPLRVRVSGGRAHARRGRATRPTPCPAR